jgi:hypothetical protein
MPPVDYKNCAFQARLIVLHDNHAPLLTTVPHSVDAICSLQLAIGQLMQACGQPMFIPGQQQFVSIDFSNGNDCSRLVADFLRLFGTQASIQDFEIGRAVVSGVHGSAGMHQYQPGTG